MRFLAVLLLAAIPAGVACADVTVLTMDDPAAFTVDEPIKPLVVENRDGRRALHMRLPCTGTGVAAIRHIFAEPQDWRGYDTLHWELLANTTGASTHIQVQLFDAANHQVMMRRDIPAHQLGRWLPMSWDFVRAQPQDAPLDFSRVKMIFFSAWQDFYGHEAGVTTDYWIGPVTRSRAWEPTALAAAPTTAAPAIDGRLDDACWATTPAAQQFFARKGEGLPKETSELRALWDARDLYLAVRCRAEVLRPALQRTGEFIARATEHDGRVFHDDSIEIFLGPPDAPTDYMQFVTNALGTRYEGRGMDGSWDVPWQAAGATGDEGFWSAEVAIPWSSLGIEPAAGSALWLNVCRNNIAQNEVSMFSPVTHGFHAPDEFGRLVLLAEAPRVVVEAGTIPALMMGANAIEPTLTGIAGGEVVLRWRVTQGERTTSNTRAVPVAAGATERAELPIEIDTPGEVSVVYAALDAATDALYYQSPVCHFATAAVAAATISADGPCEVFLNGASLGRGGAEPLVGYLEPGPNVLGVVAEEPVAVRVTVGGLNLAGTAGWRQADAPAEGWLEPQFDDSGWRPAADAGGKLDPAQGTCFRRVIAAEATHFASLGDPDDIHIVAGGAQHLPLVVASPLERPLQGAVLVIETPPGLELLDWADKQPYEWTGTWAGYQAEPFERDGEQWTRHELAWELLQPVTYREGAHESYDNERLHTLGLVVRAGDLPPGVKHVYLWVEGEGGAVVEVPRDVPLTVLPPLPGKRPREIELLMCHGFGAGNYAGPDMTALLDTMAAAGFNAYIERTHAREVYYPLLAERGFKIVAESTHYHWHRGIDTEGNRFVDFDEAHRGSGYTFACPRWIINEGRQRTTEALASYLREAPVPPQGLWWDMEYGPMTACFCPRCLGAFAEQFGIAGELTPTLVMEQHKEQWTEFCCQTWAQLSGVYREGLRMAVPDGEMYTYSGYQTPRARGLYCIDWSIMRDFCDVASAGYGWNEQVIADTVTALDGVPLLGGEAYYRPPRNPNLKVDYLKHLLAGCRGVMHYQWTPMDGLDYTRIAEAASLVADHEAFFVEGRRADERVQGVPERARFVLERDGELLAIIVNPSSVEETHTLAIAGATGAVSEYYTGQTFADAAQVQLTVPAHDARALIVRLAQ